MGVALKHGCCESSRPLGARLDPGGLPSSRLRAPLAMIAQKLIELAMTGALLSSWPVKMDTQGWSLLLSSLAPANPRRNTAMFSQRRCLKLYFAAWPSFSSRWSLAIIRAMPSRARRRRPFLLIHGTLKVTWSWRSVIERVVTVHDVKSHDYLPEFCHRCEDRLVAQRTLYVHTVMHHVLLKLHRASV